MNTPDNTPPSNKISEIKNSPNPEVRQQIVEAAFKNSLIKAAYLKVTQPKDEVEQALLWLSHAEASINEQMKPIIKADAMKNGDWNRQMAGFTLAQLWREKLMGCAKEEFHVMLAVVLTRIGMDWLEQVDTNPPLPE